MKANVGGLDPYCTHCRGSGVDWLGCKPAPWVWDGLAWCHWLRARCWLVPGFTCRSGLSTCKMK